MRLKLVEPSKALRTRIATVLSRLAEPETGKLTKTEEGKGNTPNKYKKRSDFSDDAEKERLVAARTTTSLFN